MPVLTSAQAAPACRAPAPPPLRFGAPVYVDKARAGGEPVVMAAPDGSILVTAHSGTTHLFKDPSAAAGIGDFAVGHANQTLNWRSTDGGKTFAFVGLAGRPVGPHSAMSTGFSDPDLTVDAGGRIYNTEITFPANVSVYTSTDNGASWSQIANPVAGTGDRPWLTGMGKNEVFLYVNSPKQLWHSTDGGLTFALVATSFPVNGKMLVDPLHPDGGLIGPVTATAPADGTEGRSTGGVAFSEDRGKTWNVFDMEETPKSTAFFSAGAMAVDKAGTVYVATAGGYQGPDDVELDGEVNLMSFDRRTKSWSAPVRIPAPPGDAMWPWVVAGDAGRVAVLWLHRPTEAHEFHLYVAQTLNATGSMVRCDGRSRRVGPTFAVVDVSRRPIHANVICLDGTSCNLDTRVTASDRRLGEYVTVAVDPKGRLLVAASDTMLKSPTNGPKPVSNPLFVGQTGGARLFR